MFGGTTETHPLLAGSPAIDTGNFANCINAPISNDDQRTASRPINGCDAGAFEATGNPVITVTNNNQDNVTITAGGADDVTVLAFTLTNNSGGPVTIDGVSGVLDISQPDADPDNFQVYANGSSSPLAGADVSIDGRAFTVTFNGTSGFVFNNGDRASYIVTADFSPDATTTASIAMPVFAGGLLCLACSACSVSVACVGAPNGLCWP